MCIDGCYRYRLIKGHKVCKEFCATANKYFLGGGGGGMSQTLMKILHRIAFRALCLLYGYSKCYYKSL